MPRKVKRGIQHSKKRTIPSGNGGVAAAGSAESKITDDKGEVNATTTRISLGPNVVSNVEQLTADMENLGHSSSSKLPIPENQLLFKIKQRKTTEVDRLKKQAMLTPTLTVDVFNHPSANKTVSVFNHPSAHKNALIETQTHIPVGGKENQNQCNICKRIFSRFGNLTRHMKSHYGENSFNFNCSICEKPFNTSQDMKKHMSIVHIHTKEKFNPLRLYKCGICAKSFVSLLVFIRHMKLHDRKRAAACYKCNICFTRFFEFNTLKIHCETHKGENVHKCHICKRFYYSRMTLSKHMKYHTGSGLESFTCIICDKRFWTRWHLKTHMRFHLRELANGSKC